MRKKDNYHGGDWASYEMEHGSEPLDFSMNVNPLGMPEGVAKAIASAAKKADRYPDPKCRRLRRALADHEGVPEEWIFCGNGAADIIDRIGAVQKEKGLALVTAPTFSEYGQALRRWGWEVKSLELEECDGFRMVESFLEKMGKLLSENEDQGSGTSGERIVFLCEPNNPTGITTDRKLLDDILRVCREYGAMLVIDECFNGFLDEPEEHTMKDNLEKYPKLIILKAFTKLYGMAGVRLGYCLCSGGEILERLGNAGQPWNVSYLAEEAGLAALKEKNYVDRTRQIIKTERAYLKEQLSLMGVGCVYGEANYILFQWDGGGSLPEMLREKGILIRDCSNYEGLEEGWYRIAVRNHEDNDKLIRCLNELKIREGQYER